MNKDWIYVPLFLSVLFASSYLSVIQQSMSQTENFSTYQTARPGFKIQYPSDWKVVPLSEHSGYNGGIIFESPNKGITFSVLVELTNRTFEGYSSDILHYYEDIKDMNDIISRIYPEERNI